VDELWPARHWNSANAGLNAVPFDANCDHSVHR
jgi:hypothetical protein